MEIDGKQRLERVNVTSVVTALLQEFNTVADYRTLRNNLPQRLVHLLACRGVLIYLSLDGTLQLASGIFDDKPGWSSAMLAVAHIEPLSKESQAPEARAWREKQSVSVPGTRPTLLALPLLSRQQCIGVLVAVRGRHSDGSELPQHWAFSDVEPLEAIAGVVALLLENTRLRERDRERIHELSLLNSISSQLHSSFQGRERLRDIVIQRTREISGVDLCELLEPETSKDDLTEVPHPWITPGLRAYLFQWCNEQHTLTPLVIEHPGSGATSSVTDVFKHLPARIKTFFAIPLLSDRALDQTTNTSEHGSRPVVLGLIIGGHYHTRKLRRAELALLQVLACQICTVMENMRLMAEVIEARNEARTLLYQVLDDRRLKELILESIPSGLITTDLEGRIQTFNRAAATILGYHPYEVLGQSLHRFLDMPVPMSSLPLAVGEAQNRPGTVAETDGLRHTKLAVVDRFERKKVLEVDACPFYDDRGGRVGTLVTFSDMTSIQHLEEEKRRLDRLAALGEMAAGVAHEVRNPLASIKTSVQILRDDLGDHELAVSDPDWTQSSLNVVLKEVERLDSIVRDLLSFARPRQLHRVRCNLAELSDQVLDLLSKQLDDAGIVVHRVYEELPPAWLDIGQMEQILLNLITNAIQAMPDGGIITVLCRAISKEHLSTLNQYDERSLPQLASARSSSFPTISPSTAQATAWLECMVSDTGGGIAPTQQERIFQPFFTTKAHGIGLGLPITRRLVEDHGGTIHIESQLGYGASMVVRLPVVTYE